ncbi:SLBB domain-containing protein [Ensifer canadensis]|uniref:SLBB domain-containing protein n=1 Tax=Ensifer canadensis TaxID=555315 RepID=UPI00148FBC30
MKRISALFLVATIASCQAVPGEGPLASAIVSDAGKSASELNRRDATVFDIVDVNSQSAQLISSYTSRLLSQRFGVGGGSGKAHIGVGDHLMISIFEAGRDGLFSTSKSKAAKIDVIVQPDGKAAIPYVGLVQFAGLSLEQARQEIIKSLTGKAIEPDVIVSSIDTASRKVTVTGNVNRPSVIPLNLAGDKLSDVIAKAGGPESDPYDSLVTLTRGKRTGTVLMSAVIDDPTENVGVQPGDEITVIHDPRQFTVLGAVKSDKRVKFGSRDVNLVEAMGLARGPNDKIADVSGFFVFRYEEPEVVSALLGEPRFNRMLRQGMIADGHGRYPLVYRFDMSRPDSLLAGQNFAIKHRDIIYASRHPSVDFAKFLNLVGEPLRVANSGVSIAQHVSDMTSD